MKGPLRDLFDASQLLTDVSGSGNNWGHGYCVYGPKYEEAILDQLHRAVEACDSPQVGVREGEGAAGVVGVSVCY
jgi:tubulin epsilon